VNVFEEEIGLVEVVGLTDTVEVVRGGSFSSSDVSAGFLSSAKVVVGSGRLSVGPIRSFAGRSSCRLAIGRVSAETICSTRRRQRNAHSRGAMEGILKRGLGDPTAGFGDFGRGVKA
jgi:hypothetical protein